MASFVKFDTFVEAVHHGKHDFSADTLKVALTNTAPTAATDTVFDPVTNHPPPAAANGYTTGGEAVTTTSSGQTSGIYKLVLTDEVITASGGSIGPFRYVVLYNDDAPLDELIGYWDYGSSITLADGEAFTVDFNAGSGVFQNS